MRAEFYRRNKKSSKLTITLILAKRVDRGVRGGRMRRQGRGTRKLRSLMALNNNLLRVVKKNNLLREIPEEVGSATSLINRYCYRGEKLAKLATILLHYSSRYCK
nr:hypothetical protein [Tanacetum cinerariifolium]